MGLGSGGRRRAGKAVLACVLAWSRVFWWIVCACVFVWEQANSHSLWRRSRLLETEARGNPGRVPTHEAHPLGDHWRFRKQTMLLPGAQAQGWLDSTGLFVCCVSLPFLRRLFLKILAGLG